MLNKPVGSLDARCCGCDENFFPGDEIYAWFTGEEFCAGCYDGIGKSYLFEPPYAAIAKAEGAG